MPETAIPSMMLTPRETEKLVIYQVAELARKSVTEAAAIGRQVFWNTSGL